MITANKLVPSNILIVSTLQLNSEVAKASSFLCEQGVIMKKAKQFTSRFRHLYFDLMLNKKFSLFEQKEV